VQRSAIEPEAVSIGIDAEQPIILWLKISIAINMIIIADDEMAADGNEGKTRRKIIKYNMHNMSLIVLDLKKRRYYFGATNAKKCGEERERER